MGLNIGLHNVPVRIESGQSSLAPPPFNNNNNNNNNVAADINTFVRLVIIRHSFYKLKVVICLHLCFSIAVI